MWGYLLHLGYNMWNDVNWYTEYGGASDTLRCDVRLWDELVRFMAKSGINTCVIDLGEGLKYESHPELAVKRSWSSDFFKKETCQNAGGGDYTNPKTELFHRP